MKIKSIFFAAAALLFAASCTEIEQNNPELQQPEAKYVIYANAPATKTALEADGAVTWVKGDVIAVAQRGVETATAELAHFTNMSENGATAAFEGVRLPSHNDIVAVYPASAFVKETTAGSVVNIPAVQYAEAGKFPVNAASNGAVINPSYAYCASENEQGQIVMNFKNLGGLLGFELPAYLENISEIVLESAAALTGNFNLTGVEGERGSLTATESSLKTVTLRPTAAEKVFKTGVKYFAAIAPVDAEGVNITLKTYVGGTFVKTSAKFPLNVPVSTRRTIQLGNVVANAKVGDCFLADGTWADFSKEKDGHVDGKEVLGYVISTDTSRMNEDNAIGYSLTGELDQRIVKGVRHGYVVSKTINKRQWGDPSTEWVAHVLPWSINTRTNPYYVYDEYTALGHRDPMKNSPYTVNSDKMYGYANSQYWNSQNISLINTKPAFSPYSTICYVPSLGDMKFLLAAFAAVNCTELPFSNYVNKEFWTSSISRSYNAWGPSQVYASVTFTFSYVDGKLTENSNLMAGRQYENNVMYLMAF